MQPSGCENKYYSHDGADSSLQQVTVPVALSGSLLAPEGSL